MRYKMYIKIHRSYRNVVAICDAELIGKTFEEGKRQLELRENFYKDKKVQKKELIKMIHDQTKEDATFNIVGEKATETAIEAGIIIKENIVYIQNIPFALILT